MKRFLSIFLSLTLIISLSSCTSSNNQSSKEDSVLKAESTTTAISTENTQGKTPEERAKIIVSQLTLEQKAAQMMQCAVYQMTPEEMKKYNYASVLSSGIPEENNANGWKKYILSLQKAAMDSETKIPFVFGNDAVHGHNTVSGSIIFPHNIGIGAANDPDLTYKMGSAVAEEMKLTGVLWNFSPCVAVAQDPRWGRTYESYSSNVDIVTNLSVAFAKGQLDHGIMPTAKHFLADGNTEYGTGEPGAENEGRVIDRGDAKLTDAQIDELLKPYKALIDAGVKTIMPSHSSINGRKMHANKQLLTDKLKGEMGFDGFIISDWESIQNIPGKDLEEKIVTSVNAGIDMLMQPTNYEQCMKIIVNAVNKGKIPQSRIDDAVTRILKVKIEMGVFDDPMQEKVTHDVDTLGSSQYRDLARQLVEKSLVLVKNDNQVLPLKKGQKIYVTGPAANDVNVQCGGWTIAWKGLVGTGDNSSVPGTSILAGLKDIASEYDLKIITDKNKAKDADVTLLCIGETSYAEWTGDTKDLSIVGEKALPDNKKAINEAKKLGKPTVTLIVAGRNVLINDYIDQWDSVVMCYLPGSEGEGVANVLLNKTNFSGKLPMPWYKSIKDIKTTNAPLFEQGYGLKY